MLRYPPGLTSAGIQFCHECRNSQIWSIRKQIIIWYAFLDLKTLTGVLLAQAKWKDWKTDEKMLLFISWWWWFTGYSSEQCKPHQQELFICSLPSPSNTTGWDLHLCLFEDTWANKSETTVWLLLKNDIVGLCGNLGTMVVLLFTFDWLMMTG